jgi:hypothetical protein
MAAEISKHGSVKEKKTVLAGLGTGLGARQEFDSPV